MEKKKIKFGVLGCGNIGRVHIRAIDELEDGELIAVCDNDGGRVKKIAEEYGTKAYTSYEEMLLDGDIDAIAICTPSGMHKEQATRALLADKHIILEKPMALTAADAEELCRRAEKSNKLLSVVFQMRFSKDIQFVKRLIEEGSLGRLVLCNLSMKYWRDKSYFEASPWRGTVAMDGGGALMNQGIHGIDIMHYLLGVPRVLSSRVKTLVHTIEVEDTALALLEYPSGAIGTVEAATSITPGFGRRIEIHGTRGYAVISDLHIEKLYIDGKMLVDREVAVSLGSASDPTKMQHASHLQQYKNFVGAINGEEELVSTAHDGLAAIKTIERIYELSPRD